MTWALPSAVPPASGLYDPAREHDSCGVAFVVDVAGRRSHDVVKRGLAGVCRLDHRGARGAEPNTGDGAGITIGIPDEFLRDVVDVALPAPGAYATGLVFLPDGQLGTQSIPPLGARPADEVLDGLYDGVPAQPLYVAAVLPVMLLNAS